MTTITKSRRELPYKYDHSIKTGDGWVGPVLTLFEPDGVTPTNLTGAATNCEIRTGPNEDAPLVETALMVEDLANGKTHPTLTGVKTLALKTYQTLYYDIQITPAGGESTTYLKGKIDVERTVTA